MSDDTKPTGGTFTCDDGTIIETLIHRPALVEVVAVATIAHPHPKYGGDMHNNVVAALWRGLSRAGVATVRFNFRGVGASTGTRGDGVAERADFLAALDEAAKLVPGVPLLACGYSFGAEVALTCTHERLAAWLVVAPPLRMFPDDSYTAARDARPTHLLAGAHDAYASPPIARAATVGWRNVQIYEIPMADHFFAGSTDRIEQLAKEVALTVV